MFDVSRIVDQRSDVIAEGSRVSRDLFGNQDRLMVAVAVAQAEPDVVWARELAQRLGVPDSRVGPQLAALERAGLLERLPKIAGDRRAFFQRKESTFWTACSELWGAVEVRVAARVSS